MRNSLGIEHVLSSLPAGISSPATDELKWCLWQKACLWEYIQETRSVTKCCRQSPGDAFLFLQILQGRLSIQNSTFGANSCDGVKIAAESSKEVGIGTHLV